MDGVVQVEPDALKVVEMNKLKENEREVFGNTEDGSQWMSAKDVASCIKQVVELPKNMEVSEIIVNRKVGSKK